MSLKETILQWNEGVENYHNGKLKEAVEIWSIMQEPAARILYNIASMHYLLRDLDNAKKYLDLAVAKDPHLALAYFQKGCVALQQKRYADALDDFDLASKKLHNNPYINYKQLGLQFKLYSYSVMYNHACVLFSLGKEAEAIQELEAARGKAGFESQQKIITEALASIKEGKMFESHKLPDSAMVFQPPRNKTEVLKPVNFLGKAKVVSSVKDQDSYVGFVGVQSEKLRRSRTPSPNPSPSFSRKKVEPAPSASTGVPKPEGSAPGAPMRIRRRSITLSLRKRNLNGGKNLKKGQVSNERPPKPTQTPPILHRKNGNTYTSLKLIKTVYEEKDEIKVSKMTVKVHYSTTKAMRVSVSISFKELQSLIWKKFDREENSLFLWCKKKNGELKEVVDEQTLREMCHSLDDGFRLTMWAYDKPESEGEEDEQYVSVLMVCQATHAYKGQFEDEISFSAGDEVDITADINDDWYEGRCNGAVGIFPKSYVKAAKL